MSAYALPDERGHFGKYGGIFVAETLMEPLAELRQAYETYMQDPEFQQELARDLKEFVGRPSSLYLAERWSENIGGARIPARTRSTTRSARSCWPGAWARPASLPRPVPGSTAWRRRPLPRAWAWNAWSTWAKRTFAARRLMFIA